MLEPKQPLLGVKSLSPVLCSRDVGASLERFKSLGFTTHAYQPEADGPIVYGFVSYGTGDFHVALAENLIPEQSTSMCYFWVEDVQAVYDQWTGSGVEGRFSEIEDRPYGMREFCYWDPDNNLICVGEMLPSAKHD